MVIGFVKVKTWVKVEKTAYQTYGFLETP